MDAVEATAVIPIRKKIDKSPDQHHRKHTASIKKAAYGTRTHDLSLTKRVLCQLS